HVGRQSSPGGRRHRQGRYHAELLGGRMSLFARPNMRQLPGNVIVFEDGRIDTITSIDPKTGTVTQRPVLASEEEIRQRDSAAARRSLEGVEFRIVHADEVFSWEEPLTAEQLERKIAGLESERAFLLGELERLGAGDPQPKKRGKR